MVEGATVPAMRVVLRARELAVPDLPCHSLSVGRRPHQDQLLPLSPRRAERVPSEKRRVSKLKGLAAYASVG
jgi:hypothetical protein